MGKFSRHQGLVDTLAFLVSPSVGFPSYFQARMGDTDIWSMVEVCESSPIPKLGVVIQYIYIYFIIIIITIIIIIVIIIIVIVIIIIIIYIYIFISII